MMKEATNTTLNNNNGGIFTMLPFARPEVRKAYFLQAFGRPVEEMAIFSFGACNYNCPYCKRDGQFKGEGNQILRAQG